MEELSYSHSAEAVSSGVALENSPISADGGDVCDSSFSNATTTTITTTTTTTNDEINIESLVQEAKDIIGGLMTIKTEDASFLVVSFARLRQISQILSLPSTSTSSNYSSCDEKMKDLEKIKIERDSLLIHKKYLLNELKDLQEEQHPYRALINEHSMEMMAIEDENILPFLEGELKQRQEAIVLLEDSKKEWQRSKDKLSLKRTELNSLKEEIDLLISESKLLTS